MKRKNVLYHCFDMKLEMLKNQVNYLSNKLYKENKEISKNYLVGKLEFLKYQIINLSEERKKISQDSKKEEECTNIGDIKIIFYGVEKKILNDQINYLSKNLDNKEQNIPKDFLIVQLNLLKLQKKNFYDCLCLIDYNFTITYSDMKRTFFNMQLDNARNYNHALLFERIEIPEDFLKVERELLKYQIHDLIEKITDIDNEERKDREYEEKRRRDYERACEEEKRIKKEYRDPSKDPSYSYFDDSSNSGCLWF